MNWKNMFMPQILERGYDYYCNDAVENYRASSNEINADVIGSYDYEVTINLEKSKIINMFCSCPYAEDGRNCKHMAAVLFKWDENPKSDEILKSDESNKDATQPEKNEIEKLVESADISVVRSYLTTILTENEALFVRFQNMVHKRTTKEDVEFYKNQVNSIAAHYLGRQQFINYYDALDFISELEEILHTDVGLMIENEEYMSAFEVMNHIFALMGDVDMDDSDGGTGMLADQIYELWLQLLSKVNEEEKQRMFHWFATHLDGPIIDYLEEYIIQILMKEFGEKEYEQQKMHLVEEMIRKSETKESDWSRSYYVGRWALYYVSLLKKQKASRKTIEDFCRQHWENSDVREYYIDMCVRRKDYNQAIKILDESLQIDGQYSGLVSKYIQRKKDIFLLKGDKEAYLSQLWELVLKYEIGNMEVYRELKAQYTCDEWEQKREVIFEKLPKNSHVEILYKEEKLYDRLLELVLQSRGLYMLQEYSGVLKKNYPEEILGKYRDEVNKMASATGDRKKYRQLVVLLRNMKKIRGGGAVVKEMVAQWRIQYRNRPAMMDELSKL